jgi:glycosyltransferase involved in cell wall biosynthesis
MSVSIVIPTYNRGRFSHLVEHNINVQKYKNICEVLIADDGSERLEINTPYPIRYLTIGQRLNIGQKRNILASYATGEYIAHMDDDDIYFPSYISHSMKLLNSTGKECTGSHSMLMVDISWNECGLAGDNVELANEATLVYKKRFWTERGFSETQTSEAISFLSGRAESMVMSNIGKVMVCFCHSGNTVDKTKWFQYKASGLPNYYQHRLILGRIFSKGPI